MSSADPTPGCRNTRQPMRARGYSALEVIIAVAIISLLTLVIERTLSTAHDTERYLGGIRKVTERGQRIAYELREVVSSSRKLYQGDATGLGYFDALDLYDPTPPISTMRLPMFDEVNGLGPDVADDPRTGNTLLFVRESDAAPAIADPATGKQRYIDTYRFVCIYIAETKRFILDDGNRQPARDLIFWRSIAYPSYGQIANISDPVERANVVKDLYERFGYEYAWDAGKDVDSAFFAIDGSGAMSTTPEAGLRIDLDMDMVERGKLVYANTQLARTDNASHPRRAIFTVDDPGVWKPDGLEVKIAGASGSRKVWVHLVIETQAAKGKVATHASTVISSTKDL